MSAVPERIENRAGSGVLVLHWGDGRADELSHAVLRAACPCSACRALRRAGGDVNAAATIRLTAIEPVGHYAVNLGFDDGHRRGIYPFALLAGLATPTGMDAALA